MFNKQANSIKKAFKPLKGDTPSQKRVLLLTPLILSVFFFIVALGSISEKTGTTDEKFHFTRGIMLLTTGDLRINQHHPYLANVITALPGLFDDDLVLPDTDGERWQRADKDGLSSKLVTLNGGLVEFSDNVLPLPRLIMILISSAFLWLYFSIIHKEFGYRTALFSTIFIATSPTYIAHGRLVTTDIPAALTIFVATYAFYKYLSAKGDRKKKFIYFVLLYFIALLTKYTAATLIAVYVPLLILDEIKRGKKLLPSLKKGGIKTLILGLSLAIGLWAAYGFKFGTLQEMQYGNQSKIDATYYDLGQIREYSESPSLADNLQYIYEHYKFPFPQYVHGFYENVWKHNFFGHKSFFLGERSNGGWPLYFPVAFAIKEQVSTAFLSFFSVIMASWYAIRYYKKWSKMDFFKYTPFVLVPLLLVTLAFKSSLNLGVRHLIPVFPFLYLLVGISFTLIDRRYKKVHVGNTRIRVPSLILLVILVWNIGSLARSYPNYVPYFNEIIRPYTGHMYLRGSNLDWHQNDGLEQALVEDLDRNISDNLEDVAPGEYFIISSTNLYPRPEKITESMSWFNSEYDRGEIVEIIEWIGNTHVIVKLHENPYYRE